MSSERSKPNSLLAPVSALILLAACAPGGDARLEKLSAGISKDSALALMGASAQRSDNFLINGQNIETMYFPRQGQTDSASLADRNMSPLVLVNGQLAAWGWTQWDSIATENKIAVMK